jgi:hypothetical protein
MNDSEKRAGLIAGISLIVMAMAAGFAYGFAQDKLVDVSAEIMKQNLLENQSLFYAVLAAWALIFTTDLIVSKALFNVFRHTNRRISAITALVRIAYTLMLGVGILQLSSLVPLLNGHEIKVDVRLPFALFERIWSAGLIIFGFHLIGLGYLSIKSKFIPALLGYLLNLAGVSYILIHAGRQFALFGQPVIDSAETILAIPMALGELLLAIWLIYKGLRKKK